MPIQIPTYISRSAPRVIDRGGTSPASTGAPVAQGLQSVTSVLAAINVDAEKMVGDAARLGELDARTGKLKDRLGALKDSLAQDPDHKTYFDRAKKGIAEATTEAFSGVNDPALKNALLEHVSPIRDEALVNARHQSWVLTIDFTRGVLEEGIDRSIKAAVSATDARDLMRAEGEINASIKGGVKGGIWTPTQGGRIAQAAREKIATVQAAQMADQEPERFLSNHKEGLYKDVDPMRLEGFRRHADARLKTLETSDNLQSAGSAAEDIWSRMGPVSDLTPVNLDVMEGEVSKLFAGNQERAKLARAVLREKTAAHDKGVAERRAANLSAIWNAAKAGSGIAKIGSMPEYNALDGHSQYQVQKDLEDRSWTLKVRAEADPTRKAAQHRLYWETLPKLPGMSENAITAMYPRLGVELTDDLMKEKRKVDAPGKAPTIDTDVFNHWAREYGIKPEVTRYSDNRAKLGEIAYKVKREIEAEESARKRPLTRPEKETIMKRGLIEVDVRVGEKSFFSSGREKKRLFDVQDFGTIFVPPADREEIARDLKARGVPVTDDNILSQYLRKKEK